MSHGVPERFRWLYDFDPADRNALHARWHEDGVVNQTGDLPGTTGRFEGYEGLDAMLAEVESAATDLRFAPTRVIDLGEPDRHLVLLEFSARGIGSGIPIGGRIAHDVTLREGRIARMDVYATWEQALEAVGLSE
jgi:ketosteroid isomerase-like protein